MMLLEIDPSLREVQQANKDHQNALLVHGLFHNTPLLEESAELVVETSQRLREASHKYTEQHPLPFYS